MIKIVNEVALASVQQSSVSLMQEVVENHQHMTDFCYGMRFLLRNLQEKMHDGPNSYLDGIEQLIIHLDTLKVLATSYHHAVTTAIHVEENAL